MNAMPQPAQRIFALVLRFQRPLVGYVAQLTHDLESARDVVQEVFLRLCVEREIDESRVAPWLFKVARNLAIDYLRKNRRMTAIDSVGAQKTVAQLKTGADLVELQKDVEVVLSVLSTLPPNQQEVVRLRFMHELSYREISEITELSVTNVGYLLHVALTAIRVRLTPATCVARENERIG